jgi:hypothetical protein
MAAVLQWLLMGSIPEGFWVRGVIIVGPHASILVVLLILTLSDAAVELDAAYGKEVSNLKADISKRDASIVALEQATTAPPLTPLQKEHIGILAEIFDNCSEDCLRVLGQAVSGPLTAVALFSRGKLPGADEFYALVPLAERAGIISSTRGSTGAFSGYELNGPWEFLVERYVNQRLDHATSSSSIDQT